MAGSAALLLERDHELDALERATADAADGRGRLILVEAAPGLGKTSLTEAGAELAEQHDMRVLRSRGSELERGFPFGCIRQLLGPVVDPPGARSRTPPSHDRGGARPLFGLLSRLHALCAGMARERPLLLSVDDAHWADVFSLRFLAFLALRLEGLPVLVVVTARPGDYEERGPSVAQLAQELRAEVLWPGPLSNHAAAALIARTLGRVPDAAFASACHTATAGNPLYLVALLEHVRAEGIAPIAAEARRVAHLGPRAVLLSLRSHLASDPQDAVRLARALSVVGDGARLVETAALAAIDVERAGAAADVLVRRSVLAAGDGLSFAHPVVRETLYAQLPPHEREALHARAAALLHQGGASAERVAAHLLRCEPRADPDAVAILREAASAGVARGAPGVAAVHLERALREPPLPELQAEIDGELGSARLQAGLGGGVEPLREALALVPPGKRSAILARELCQALVPLERNEEAVAALEAGIDALGGDDRELELQLEADLATAGRLHPATCLRTGARLRRLARGLRGRSPGERAVLSSLAMERLLVGAPAAEVTDLATRALDGGLLAEQTADGPTFYDALFVLIVADRLDLAGRVCEAALADALRRGSRFGTALATCFRAKLAYRRGDIQTVEADAHTCIDAARGAGWRFADYALAFLIDALIDAGRIDDADTALRRGDHDVGIPHTFMHDRLLFSRARLRLDQGRRDAAIADLDELHRRERHWRACCPAALPYRSTAAIARAELGRRDEAVRLAEVELELARRFGAPRAIGIALRALGLAQGGRRAIDLLGEAVAVLEPSPARMEHARALIDLGAALRRANHRADSRSALERGLTHALRCGGTGLVQRADEELRCIGVRPPVARQAGYDGLTPSEHRVCQLAAEGLSNPEIARALFVSRKTVETHLGRAYRKLDIPGRAALPATLSRATCRTER